MPENTTLHNAAYAILSQKTKEFQNLSSNPNLCLHSQAFVSLFG